MTRPTSQFIDAPARGETRMVDLPAFGVHPRARHVLDRESALAVNAALAAERPLLVRGDPGTGKSQLARAAAVELGRTFILHAVDARTETRDLLYTVDALARLAKAQLLGALRTNRNVAMRHMDVLLFVRPGALWWAYDRASAHAQALSVRAPVHVTEAQEGGVVLLIDEIDKADPSVPNGLLDAFGNGRFEVEGRAPVFARGGTRPLVIVTSNEERALPDAFVRRCLVLNYALPANREELIKALRLRGSANVDGCDPDVLEKAAGLVADERERLKGCGVCLPGVAEYVDLLRAVTGQPGGHPAQLALLEEIGSFATRKHSSEPTG